MASLVTLEHLSKRYTPKSPCAVDDLSLSIEAGEVLGFVGPNGAGKTTTIKMMLDLVHPDAGQGTIFGLDMRSKSVEIRKRLSYMSGDANMYLNFTGNEYLKFIQSLFEGSNTARFESLCETFKVPFERKIKSYSAGQKQQLALIAALAHEAELLVLDEPTKGLDPSKKKLFLDVIHQRAEEGAAVIISSHVLSEIESICHRVSFIKNGKLLATEDIEAARKKLEDKIFVEFSRQYDLESLRLDAVKDIVINGNTAMITVADDPRTVIKQLADLPIESLRFRQASLDDLYENLYLQDAEGDLL